MSSRPALDSTFVGRCTKMVTLLATRLAVAVGGLALSLTAGAGVAFADPLDPAINTTCSYPQAVAALNAQSPAAANQFNASPTAQAWMRTFLPRRWISARTWPSRRRAFRGLSSTLDWSCR